MAFTVGPSTFLAAIETAGATSTEYIRRLRHADRRGRKWGGGGGGGSNASVGATGSPVPGSATYNGVLVAGGNIVGASGSAWGSAPTGLNVLGVNADVLSSALPAGAATAANQEVTAAGASAMSAQAMQGVTGGVPMSTNSANTGGNLTSIVQAGSLASDQPLNRLHHAACSRRQRQGDLCHRLGRDRGRDNKFHL